MGFPQLRQRARSTIQERIGTLSYQAIRAPQRGQLEGGARRLLPCGTRAITTFRKLPRHAPTTNTYASATQRGAIMRSAPSFRARAARKDFPASADAAPPRRALR